MKEQVWKNSLVFILIGLAAIDAASVSGRSKWSEWSNDNMAGNSIRHECPNGMPVGTITWFEQGGWGAPHRINDLYIVCGSFNYNSPTFRFTNNWMGASSGAKICEGGFSDIQGRGEQGNALVNVRMMCLYGRRSWYDATRNYGGSWNNRLSCDGGYITGFEVKEVAGHGIVNFRVLCGGNRQPDPVDGGYSDFGAWSECSAKCGDGEQTKTRTCTNPAPAHGGADCKGKSTKTRKCNTHGCAVDGGYSGFGDWSKCSAECGGGTQTRSRTCTNPAPANGGADCVGASSETRKCNTQGCSVDGGYSDFGDWSKCSAECGGGTQTRSRTCTNPVPANGGADCVGPSSEIRKCNTRGCITNGGYSDFGDWSECSAECGGGTQTRSRTCTNPVPANGGADCVGLGPSSENRKCNAQGCTVDGGYSDFGDWSECSAECGGGTQTRSRTCTNPAPANGGADCAGASSEERDCNTERCVSLIIKPHGETELQCTVGKWNCKPTFIVKKTKGEKVNPDDVKICKLVNGNVRDCREPRAVPGDKYLLRSGQVVASYAGAYVVVYTEDGVQHVSDPVTVTLV